jgi:flagellar motor protein MotB
MRLILISVALAIFGFSVVAQETSPSTDSNALSESPGANRALVRAMSLIADASQQPPWERFQSLESARRLFDRLVNDFPESSIAVQLATGQKIGSFDILEFHAEHEAAFSDACIITEMAGCHPFLIERIRVLRQAETDIQAALAKEQRTSEASRRQINLLKLQLDDLRKRMAQAMSLLDDFEAKDAENKATIADLGRRLNRALAMQVEKLSRYRSEFFGRLREVLHGQPGIRVVGDRFVFQSEVLFGSGSTEMGVAGRIQLTKLAETLIDISRTIPEDINWVLRVDGHTDDVPISTVRFPSNWELSAARAIAVSKYLIHVGVPPDRLAPTGFGEFHPLEPGESVLARRRNRRIELKLTER